MANAKEPQELTKEQQEKFPEYVEKWTKIALSTEPANKPEAEKAMLEIYKMAGLNIPENFQFFWEPSPLAGLKKASELVGDKEFFSQRGNCGYGCHDASWLCFFDFLHHEVKIDSSKLFPMMELAKHSAWWWPFDEGVVMTDRPSDLHLKNNRLHRDGGPALGYRDGYAIYALNGVKVTQEIAETPADKLDCKLVVKERNAEIRRELVRKIGEQRLCEDLGAKSVDKWKDYELLMLEVDHGDGVRARPFLKMVNPSIGTVHIEGVEPSIRTVKAALAWRNNIPDYKEPIVLT